MKMKDFWGMFDCFFTTIKGARVFVQRISKHPYHYTHVLYDWEIVDAVCYREEWYWANYTIEGISIIDNELHIICREWE